MRVQNEQLAARLFTVDQRNAELARENEQLRTAAGSAVLHIPPSRVLHAVAAPPTPETPALSPRGTPVSEVRRRALEARASAEALRRQNHQLLQENLSPRPRSGSSLYTPQPRDRPVTAGRDELAI